MEDSNQAGVGLRQRRRRFVRSVILLAICTVALLTLILASGDFRRRQRAMEQMQWHASVLTGRIGPGGHLPLNLEPDPAPGRMSGMLRIEWMPRDDARLMRDSGKRCAVAQTGPLLQVLGREGRAVLFFESGNFDAQWMTLEQFNDYFAKQQEELRRLADQAPVQPGETP
jgi:hypothetical protein